MNHMFWNLYLLSLALCILTLKPNQILIIDYSRLFFTQVYTHTNIDAGNFLHITNVWYTGGYGIFFLSLYFFTTVWTMVTFYYVFTWNFTDQDKNSYCDATLKKNWVSNGLCLWLANQIFVIGRICLSLKTSMLENSKETEEHWS